jgi:RecA/RadA recombinase
MEDVAARVASLRSRVDAAVRARAAAEASRQQAEQAVETTADVLRQEFGIETPAQAKALADDLDRQVAAESDKIEQALRQ